MWRSILLASLTISLGVQASADVISISLPELTGEYQGIPEVPPGEGPTERSMTLVLPPEVVSISELRLSVSGTWHEGTQFCPGHQTVFSAPLELFATIPGAPGGWYIADVWPPDGDFANLTDEFTSCCPEGILSFDQLIGTEINLTFYPAWVILGICTVDQDMYGTVTDVHLEITGTVPTTPSTWGEIKSLYR
jgi:hypothetical protein